jgi:hypothetical protein
MRKSLLGVFHPRRSGSPICDGAHGSGDIEMSPIPSGFFGERGGAHD